MTGSASHATGRQPRNSVVLTRFLMSRQRSCPLCGHWSPQIHRPCWQPPHDKPREKASRCGAVGGHAGAGSLPSGSLPGVGVCCTRCCSWGWLAGFWTS